MKFQLIYVLFFTVAPFYSSGQYKFTIRGHIDNRDEHSSQRATWGDTIVLRFYNLQRFDTVLVNNNAFLL